MRTTWVYEYDDANEQTAMRVYDTATAYNDMMFTYDEWGWMVTRAISDHTATFSYRGDKLAWIASSFPDEAANLGFNQDGMGKLRVIQKNYGDPTWLRADRGWSYAGLYHGTAGTWNVGSQSVRYTHDPSSVGGAPLAQTNIDSINGDTFMNVERDRLGSVRRVRTENAASLLEREYGPYGESYTDDGVDMLPGYTGHLLVNDGADYPLFYAPYRSYSPNSARWMTRDPLGMVDGPNEYGYVGNEPSGRRDILGLDDLPHGNPWLGGIGEGPLVCAMRIGNEAMEAAPQGGSNQDHCRVACEIEKQCGHGTGHLAAVLVEWIEFPWPWEWYNHSSSEQAAGETGATIGGSGCNVDCPSACQKSYPDAR